MDLVIKHLLATAVLSLGFSTFSACSDSSSSDVAGGVTDIGNSVATITISGTVIGASGNAIASARVVAYYDNWEQTVAIDSVEAITDKNGGFSMDVDSTANLVLYAENGDECGLAFAGDTNKIVLGNRKSLESSVSGETSGYVRIVGTHETAKVHEDGSFSFDAIPPGDISLVYVRDEKPQGYLDFKTTDERNHIQLPPLENRKDDGRFNPPDYGNNASGVDFGRGKAYYDSSFLNIALNMDGYEPVFNSDHSRAKDSDFVEGISGAARTLKEGQYIAIDKQYALGRNFTISLWTNWDGPNGNNQVLFSEKINGDSTSQIRWYFDNAESCFAIKTKTAQETKTIHFDASSMKAGSWTFLSIVSQNNNLTLYINGEPAPIRDGSEASINLGNTKSSVSFYIGGTGSKDVTWNGALDEYHIEGFAQSADWEKTIYKTYL